MNLLVIVVLIILAFEIAQGYKRGMVREVLSFLSLILMCFFIALVASGINKYFKGSVGGVIIVLFLLSVLGVVRHLLRLAFFPLKIVSKLPIVSWADKLLGAVAGVLETVFIVWIVYALIMLFDLGMIGEMIIDCTQGNAILSWLYANNWLAYFLQAIHAKMSFLPL